MKYYDSNLKRHNFRYINIVINTNLQLLLYLISVHKGYSSSLPIIN